MSCIPTAWSAMTMFSWHILTDKFMLYKCTIFVFRIRPEYVCFDSCIRCCSLVWSFDGAVFCCIWACLSWLTTNCCQTSLQFCWTPSAIISAERKKHSSTLCLSFKWKSFLAHSCWLPLVASIFSHIYHRPIQKPEWHERALFHHIHAIDRWMKYLFMKSKNMYSPLTLDSGNIDFWSTSPPPEPGPPVSQLWWLKGISASLFKCLLGPNFSSQTLFIWFCAENMKIVEASSFLTCTRNWSQDWHMGIFDVLTSGQISAWPFYGWIPFESSTVQLDDC